MITFLLVLLSVTTCRGSEFEPYAGKLTLSDDTVSAADFDQSGTVDFADFLLFAEGFGFSRGDSKYDEKLDLDHSDAIDFADFVLFAGSFGKTVPTNDDDEPPRSPHLGDCEVGMTLQSGKSCNYYSDGHTVRFSVKANGSGCRASDKTVTRVIFGARVRISIKEACVTHNINGDDVYDEPDFSASKNSDGSWTVKAVP